MNYGNCLLDSKWNLNIEKEKESERERGGNVDSVQEGERE